MEMSRDIAAGSVQFDGHDTIVSLWADRCKRYGKRVCHREKKLGIWQEYTWTDYYTNARLIGLALLELGVEEGEPVLILSEDRREWLYCDLAAAAIGAIPAGVYTTDSAKQLAYLAGDSGARVLFVENDEQLDKWLDARAEMPGISRVVVFDRDGLADFNDDCVMFLDDLIALGEQQQQSSRFEEALEAVQPDDPRMLIYTSGTTGPPKGAIITHRNMIFELAAGMERLDFRETDEQLCFLPLCHVLERLVSVDAPIANGSTVNFAESPETVFDNLREVSPDTFAGVPRIWEKMYSRVMIMRAEASRLGGWAFDAALFLGRRHASATRPSLGLRLAYWLAQATVLHNLRRMMGLANARRVTSGAAPISPELINWFGAVGIPLTAGRGLRDDRNRRSCNGELGGRQPYRHGRQGPARM